MKLAFIGLGVMGYPMAGHLQKAGHDVTVYNRTTEKAEKWVKEYGGNYEITPAAASQNAEIIFSCVGNDDDLRAVVLKENGIFNAMSKGAILVDHTTVSAQISRELNELADFKGYHFLDAPVSGGQAGAQNALLTIMVGGNEKIYQKAKPIMDHFAQKTKYMGASGNGQLTKMVNQICIAGLVQGLSEALHFAKETGLDIEQVVEVISKGAAGSWQMTNRHETMAKGEFEHGFAVDLMRKDLAIVKDEAAQNGADLPIMNIVDQYYAEIQKMGGGRYDTSSLLMRLKRNE